MASTSKMKQTVKTRNGSGTKLSEYPGGVKNFLISEIPTLRDVLRKGVLLQEENM